MLVVWSKRGRCEWDFRGEIRYQGIWRWVGIWGGKKDGKGEGSDSRGCP